MHYPQKENFKFQFRASIFDISSVEVPKGQGHHMTRNKLAIVSAGAVAALIFGTSPAAAYLDPGTGSMVLQSVIGAVVGALIVLKLYWHRIKMFFSPKEGDKSDKNNSLDGD
jgi:hypothetical protein